MTRMSDDRPISTTDVRAPGCSLLAGPRCTGDDLIVSDFFSERAMRFVYEEGEFEAHSVSGVPGRATGLGFTPSGNLLVTSMLKHRIDERSMGRLHEVADLSGWKTGPGNDMLIDLAGRAPVGNLGIPDSASAPLRRTQLVIVEPDGTARSEADDVVSPNGMALTRDGAELLLAETYAGAMTTLSIVADADAEGIGIARVAEGGEVLDHVTTGEIGVYAAVLGGSDLRTLDRCCAEPVGTRNPLATRRSLLTSARVDIPGVAGVAP